MEIRIENWDKYQKRQSDIKQPYWFSFHNRFFEDSDFFDFTQGEMLFWVYLLCQASTKKKNPFCLNFEHAKRIGRFTEKQMESALYKLAGRGMVALRTQHVRDATPTRQDKTLQNNIPTECLGLPKADRLNFEQIYQAYPRKIKKGLGFQRLKAQVKTEAQFIRLVKAVENYRAHCEREKLESKFIQHFSTWANQWEDWVDSEAGKGEDFSEQRDIPVWELLEDKKWGEM